MMNHFFECPHGCGRKFDDNQRLEDHIKRRHFLQQKVYPSLYENTNGSAIQKRVNVLRSKLPQLNDNHSQVQQQYSQTQQQLSESINTQQLPPKPISKLQLQFKKGSILRPNSSNKKLDDVQKNADQKDKQSNENKEIQKSVKIIEPSPVISAQDLVEARKLITKQFICTNSDASDLESVTHLTLNEKNLLVFESTTEVPFQDLISLKSLSLSQNKLINVIGISVLHNIVDLNLNNNKISTLQPLGECKRLQKLYANNNLINSIEMGLMIHLKIFQIGNNQITEFEHLVNSIKLMPSLKDLVIECNPCTHKYAYKYDILWTVFLDKLDNQIITQQDYNLAQAFKDSKQESKLSQSVMFSKGMRPQTASTMNQSIPFQDPQNENSQTNIVLEQINQELEEEIEELYDINSNMREKIDKLEKQNVEYRLIAERVPFLEEQLQDMRSKISAYESLIIFKDSPDNELRKHIFALTQELEKLKSNNNHLENYEEENQTKFNINQSKFQNTETTFIQQLSQAESDNENKGDDEDDDDKYFRDDENISQIPGQEIMELIMRNSMTLSKLKDEFKDIN
ncbi:unnamed protein product (macronuclear) [Paramecium tetraurelia]|uniref:C2H2-type domain-containing protein n=1 Tax=Paramecium tetraurelia TaxID=5888 RepID=A0CSU2_PARTE|nr:uncharacterized protein GSPATT00010131001 [Paramecium tetraurelia]CAK73859.1 unnamed protein product [Paramecium tetraurelia]|eukprot:XP_001441256.1 hypothetical protein (macronuclear) [Paramecium tetraurelia strain d4-2]